MPRPKGTGRDAPPARRSCVALQSRHGRPLLEVTVLGPRDVAGAREVARTACTSSARATTPAGCRPSCPRGRGLPPVRPPRLRAAAAQRLLDHHRRRADLPSSGWRRTTSLRRHRGVVRVLDSNLEIDTEVCAHLASSLPGVPWTFHRAVDATLDPPLVAAAARAAGAGRGPFRRSPQGLEVGYDDLLSMASADERIAALLMPSGGLQAEHVPWLVRTGWRCSTSTSQVRPGASYKSYVDAGHVRSWRLLVDSAAVRAAGRAIGSGAGRLSVRPDDILIDLPNVAGHGRCVAPGQ